jgi:hypothetical protein
MKEYITLSKELAELLNAKNKENNLNYCEFYENQEIDTRLFFEYLYEFELLIQKNFYYRSS